MATASSQSYYNEVQSIFIELFDRPALAAGHNYFGSELATGANPVTVFEQIAGSPEVSSSLTVPTLFENLLGRAPAAAGLNFFNGELAAGMTISQVASQIYFDVLGEPTNSQDPMVMQDKIAYANYYTWHSAASSSVYTHTLLSTDTGYAFPASSSQPDTLIIPFGYSGSSLGTAGNNGYFTFTGDASGLNAVDINYSPNSVTNMTYYLENAQNFQTLDFNYSQGILSMQYYQLDLSQINSGFNTFVLDDTYGTPNNYSGYGFTNATNNDTFVVQAMSMELDINNAYASNYANVIMDGGTNGVQLGTLYFSPYSSVATAPAINIHSIGSAANTIQYMGDSLTSSDNLTGSFALNIYGSDQLNIGSASPTGYTPVGPYDNGIELQDGSTLTIVGHSSGSSLTAYIDHNSPTMTQGITVNAAGFAGNLTLIEAYSSAYPSPDTFILGSGTDSVATNYVSATVTVGSGTDTVVSNAAYSTDAYYGPTGDTGLGDVTTPGYITTVKGIAVGDFLTFGTPLGTAPANWQIYSMLSTPTDGTGTTIGTITQYNESGAASQTAAIQTVIASLEAMWVNAGEPGTSGAQAVDNAGLFQYGGNTFIVNSANLQNQVIELVGTFNASDFHIITSAGTATLERTA